MIAWLMNRGKKKREEACWSELPSKICKCNPAKNRNIVVAKEISFHDAINDYCSKSKILMYSFDEDNHKFKFDLYYRNEHITFRMTINPHLNFRKKACIVCETCLGWFYQDDFCELERISGTPEEYIKNLFEKKVANIKKTIDEQIKAKEICGEK